ncbi:MULTISPECIES: RrF2 family transcriptional regulator [Clostridiaceae]|uniref:Rrf2 family transcriptional regulator n=1 Tax=Clostridium facile TaxID=2763035 RepID=A0ABR7IP55_9CLOT|nr:MULTISPECIES: Rrf2 family transcriptional regulator [Clostridiaceae]MBC5786854.1 Rrf2 family transcriptional regulator [Clostridium facile]
MYINLESDYAVRIVSFLCRDGMKYDAKTIAENTGVTLRFALKILRKLVAAGIVKSYKGTQGGYKIAKPADEITLLEVIETMEGRYCFSRCLNEEHSCGDWCSGMGCKVQRVYSKITDQVREELSKVTFKTI